MAPPVRIVVAGAGGRMGQALVEAVLGDAGMTLVGTLDIPGSPEQGCDPGARLGRSTSVRTTSDVTAALAGADVLIDFTRPAGTLVHVAACAEMRVAAVVGTTGLAESEQAALARHATTVPIIFAANMSVGVNVLLSLVETAARSLGPDFDVEILEMHHKHKVDAPSGTALRLGEAAAAGLGTHLRDVGIFAREGVTGERKAGTIGFATLRGGDVVGEHTVMFAGTGERIEISHCATSRQNFAAGALRAAHFVAAKRATGIAGLFDMRDVLGLT